MNTYNNPKEFIASKQDIKDKIAAIDQIIMALLMSTIEGAENANYDEYSLDDGQTVIRTKYRSIVDVTTAIANFRRIRTMFVNDAIGHTIRLVDSKNFYC